MLSKRLIPILISALLIPAASAAAAPLEGESPSPAWLGESATCPGGAATAGLSGSASALAPAALPVSSFDQRQNAAVSCGLDACAPYCASFCSPCGGVPYKCTLTSTGDCRAVCLCYRC